MRLTEIIRIVVKRVLNLLTNLEEAKEQERSKCDAWNCDPSKTIKNLKLSETR